MTRRIDGVVAVVDQLTHRWDDSHAQPVRQVPHGGAHPGAGRVRNDERIDRADRRTMAGDPAEEGMTAEARPAGPGRAAPLTTR
jgi:hypothetical protein